MKNWIKTFLMTAFVVGASVGYSVPLEAQSVPTRLKDVKTVYVTPFQGTNPDIANMIHAKLISALSKVSGISVVEEADNADAILTGSGLLETPLSNGHFYLQGGMRLFSKEGGVVLWADNITSSRFARSASSSFAENVAKSLRRLVDGQVR